MIHCRASGDKKIKNYIKKITIRLFGHCYITVNPDPRISLYERFSADISPVSALLAHAHSRHSVQLHCYATRWRQATVFE